MDIKGIFEQAEQKKKALQKLAASANKTIGASIKNEEDKDFLQNALKDALSGKTVDINALNERVTKMTNGS